MIPLIPVSKNQKKIDKYLDDFIKENNFMPFSIFKIEPDGKAISLDQIKEIRRLVMTTSREKRLIIIYTFDNSTIEAQNALLKTLEDPGGNQFILIVNNEENILGTVRSRAKLVYLDKESVVPDSKKIQKEKQELFQFLDEVTGSKSYKFLEFKRIDKIAREDASVFFDQAILYFKKKLEQGDLKAAFAIKQAFLNKKLLMHNNLNPQLAVDNFLIYIVSVL